MNWQNMIKSIQESGIPAPGGGKWSYERIGKEIGLSKAAVGRLAIGTKADIYFTPGKALVDLYLKITQEVEKRGSNTTE